MKLVTDSLLVLSELIGTQDGLGDEAIVLAKYFTMGGTATWLITDFSSYPDGRRAFGFCYLGDHMADGAEMGYVSFDQLEELSFPHTVERDQHWKPITLGEAKQREFPLLYENYMDGQTG